MNINKRTMKFSFQMADIKQISQIFGSKPSESDGQWMWHMQNAATRQQQTVTLHNNVKFGKHKKGSLVVVQTKHGYFELHDCTGFIIFEPDEVIFVSATSDKLSCMVIGRECTCSMFSPIRREILTADFSELDPAILMSAMQLSLTATILP